MARRSKTDRTTLGKRTGIPYNRDMIAYRFRIDPTPEQERILSDTLETCRRLYNEARQQRIDSYRQSGISLSYTDQANALVGHKNDWQQRVHSQVIQATLKRLERAFERFFRPDRNGKKAGFPRFKKRGRFRSFTYPQSGFQLDGNAIRLSKIGAVPIRIHRKIEGRIKTCSVVKDADHWFVVLVTDPKGFPIGVEHPEASVGIDMGLLKLATFTEGESSPNPRYYRKAEKKLKRLQKALSRKQKGSTNRAKARIKVARQHRTVRNQRRDFAHKVSTKLVRTYGHIVFEKLNIKGMVKNRRLAKSIHDAAWYQVIALTQSKASRAGSRVEWVDPKGTSQRCSGCGWVVKKDLSVRVHACPFCGLVMDRDENAAMNILALGSRERLNALRGNVSPSDWKATPDEEGTHPLLR